MAAPVKNQLPQQLQIACEEAKRLEEFTKTVKENPKARYGYTRPDFDALFKNTLWKEPKQASGHRIWKHLVTGTVVNYVDRKNAIDPGTVMSVCNKLEEHLDALKNNVAKVKEEMSQPATSSQKGRPAKNNR
jgi:hypothetical protein